MPGAVHWPGDAVQVRGYPLPSTQGEDSLHRRRCIECGTDCTDFCAAIFVGDWCFYCLPDAIEFMRAYLAAAAA